MVAVYTVDELQEPLGTRCVSAQGFAFATSAKATLTSCYCLLTTLSMTPVAAKLQELFRGSKATTWGLSEQLTFSTITRVIEVTMCVHSIKSKRPPIKRKITFYSQFTCVSIDLKQPMQICLKISIPTSPKRQTYVRRWPTSTTNSMPHSHQSPLYLSALKSGELAAIANSILGYR